MFLLFLVFENVTDNACCTSAWLMIMNLVLREAMGTDLMKFISLESGFRALYSILVLFEAFRTGW